jgi:[ribosomal protein S18]-alanine N-acetyltransferase
MRGATRLPAGWSIEPMRLDRDLDGVMVVEAASFVNHWTHAMFDWEARHSDVARVFVLRRETGEVVGYCAVWLIFDELHINNLALLPTWRGRGLGSALLDEVLCRCAEAGATRATLEVRASNEAARRLYQGFGFKQVGLRRQYYTNPAEDALIMWCDPLPQRPPHGSAPGPGLA